MKWARFSLLVYGGVVLAIIARAAFADGNTCTSSVTGGRNGTAVLAECSHDDCSETGFCEAWAVSDIDGITFYMWFPSTGWRAYGGGAGDIEYCACVAYGGEPPEPYIDEPATVGIGCCRAVVFKPPSGGSWVGTVGYCGDGCPTGDCGIDEDALGVVTGVCQ